MSTPAVGNPFHKGDRVRLKPEVEWQGRSREGVVSNEPRAGTSVLGVRFDGTKVQSYAFHWERFELIDSSHAQQATPAASPTGAE